MKMIKQLLIFSLFTLSLNAYAQDDESDSLDDILGGDDEETSTKEEKEAIVYVFTIQSNSVILTEEKHVLEVNWFVVCSN